MSFTVVPGSIGFAMHHESFVSSAIAWFTGSKWGHTFLVSEVTERSVYTCETCNWCATIGKLDFYRENAGCSYEVWAPLNRDELCISNGIDWAERQWERRYGWEQFPFQAIRELFRKIGVNFPNLLTTGIQCDDIVVGAYKKMGSKLFERLKPGQTTPEDVYRIVSRSGKFMLVEAQYRGKLGGAR